LSWQRCPGLQKGGEHDSRCRHHDLNQLVLADYIITIGNGMAYFNHFEGIFRLRVRLFGNLRVYPCIPVLVGDGASYVAKGIQIINPHLHAMVMLINAQSISGKSRIPGPSG